MALFYFLRQNKIIERPIPEPEACVLSGIPWGRPDVLFTPAYWMTQYWMQEDVLRDQCHRLGRTLREEVAACLLGGHGIRAEVGLAVFFRLRNQGVFDEPNSSAEVLSEHLRQPLFVGGRLVTYRFWAQRAHYVADALKAVQDTAEPGESAKALRGRLMQLRGVGPKTASWIVRNWLGSHEVAILDVHVVRAGILMGLYSTNDRVERHYMQMEHRFLDLAAAMNVPAGFLDSIIWLKMRQTPRLVSHLFKSLENPG